MEGTEGRAAGEGQQPWQRTGELMLVSQTVRDETTEGFALVFLRWRGE
jgi:hypothetical protein